MGNDTEDSGGSLLSPDDAFAAIGHETRVRILEALATTDRSNRPLAFSELYDCVEVNDSAQFNYHLDKLVGHFVERTDDGYDLYRAGGRVAEAILSGAVTENPVLERTQTDLTCHYCGEPIELTYRQERVETYCTDCAGIYGKSNTQEEEDDIPYEHGFLGNLNLPPVGIQDRTPAEVHEAAHTWSLSERLLAASDMCPRCSATLEEWIDVCEDHQHGDSGCDNCNNRYAVLQSASCTNCVFAQRVAFGLSLLDHTELQAFLTAHGINLLTPEYDRYSSVVMDYEETVLGTDPFEARFTFTAGDDAISMTVDDDLDVVGVSKQGNS